MARVRRFSIDHLYLIVVAGALFVAGYGLWAALSGQQEAPPIHYSAAEYAPEKAVYLPGETLIYTPTLTVKQEGRVDVLRSFWSRTTDSAALLCDGTPAPTVTAARNLPAGEVGNVRGGRAVRVDVPKLPPGDYWLISSATGPGGGQSVYNVSFSIRKPC